MLGKWQEKSSGFRLVSGWTSLVTVEGPLPETDLCLESRVGSAQGLQGWRGSLNFIS